MNDFKTRLLEQMPPGTSRRDFLKLMGAVIVMGSLEGCREHDPIEEVVAYARTPESALEGPYSHFASALVTGDSVLGVRATSHQGRPIKIEGNPLHPFSRGTTNVYAQGALYDLYDPHRASEITQNGEEPRDWPQFRRALAQQLKRRPDSLRLLISPLHSPTDQRLLLDVLKAYPRARVATWSSVASDTGEDGARLAFGRPLSFVREFSRADVAVLFDDDRFGSSAEGLKEAREWVARRSVDRPDFERKNERSKLFVAEPTWTFAGGLAERRLPVLRRRIPLLVRELARRADLAASAASVVGAAPAAGAAADELTQSEIRWIDDVHAALGSAKGAVLLGAGPAQPADVHELLHRLNDHYGSRAPGEATITYFEKSETTPGFVPDHRRQSIREFADDVRSGAAETVLILGGNPIYDLPSDLRTELAVALPKCPFTAYLGSYVNETSRACLWHVPLAHDLESWGDLQNADGTTCLVQPLIAPLYNGRGVKDVLSVCLDGENAKESYTLTRETWRRWAKRNEFDFENWWRRQLVSGVIENSAQKPVRVSQSKPNAALTRLLAGPPPEPTRTRSNANAAFDIVFVPDASAWDGRYVNNAWLQELPRPFSELTWDNTANVSPETAQRLQIRDGDLIKLRLPSKVGAADADTPGEIVAPVHVMGGLPENQFVLPLGYGGQTTGIGAGIGVDVGSLRTSDRLWSRADVAFEKTGRRYALAFAQKASRIEDESATKPVSLGQALAKKKDEPSAGLEPTPNAPVTLDQRPQRWGMAIDLDTCIACKVCTIACQVENNIPVVGKPQVLLGREMHWIRIDRYTRHSGDATKFDPQPVPCMHCEKAPCEYVCPVNASVHSSDGLNQQVYNRCIGTRFCANNCPYKVRRFNFLKYSGWPKEESLRQAYNPDVTVRWRGVMEKCTYCIQRINRARLSSEIEKREIKDGDIQTACQQACPTKAIVFGDLDDPKSLVRQLKTLPRESSLLAELGTRPRTTYLAKVDR